MKHIYTISNTNGLQGAVWRLEYESRAKAGEAIRRAMGWESLLWSAAFETKYGTGWCVYETESTRTIDFDGAHAPRVSRTWIEKEEV